MKSNCTNAFLLPLCEMIPRYCFCRIEVTSSYWAIVFIKSFSPCCNSNVQHYLPIYEKYGPFPRLKSETFERLRKMIVLLIVFQQLMKPECLSEYVVELSLEHPPLVDTLLKLLLNALCQSFEDYIQAIWIFQKLLADHLLEYYCEITILLNVKLLHLIFKTKVHMYVRKYKGTKFHSVNCCIVEFSLFHFVSDEGQPANSNSLHNRPIFRYFKRKWIKLLSFLLNINTNKNSILLLYLPGIRLIMCHIPISRIKMWSG